MLHLRVQTAYLPDDVHLRSRDEVFAYFRSIYPKFDDGKQYEDLVASCFNFEPTTEGSQLDDDLVLLSAMQPTSLSNSLSVSTGEPTCFTSESRRPTSSPAVGSCLSWANSTRRRDAWGGVDPARGGGPRDRARAALSEIPSFGPRRERTRRPRRISGGLHPSEYLMSWRMRSARDPTPGCETGASVPSPTLFDSCLAVVFGWTLLPARLLDAQQSKPLSNKMKSQKFFYF
ncbi:hypothetical protein AHF37_05723 [Paragonimus kellicotti]|nr:hypothetical protein AHF37_05723 [Paragonimus kellicotti]